MRERTAELLRSALFEAAFVVLGVVPASLPPSDDRPGDTGPD